MFRGTVSPAVKILRDSSFKIQTRYRYLIAFPHKVPLIKQKLYDERVHQ